MLSMWITQFRTIPGTPTTASSRMLFQSSALTGTPNCWVFFTSTLMILAQKACMKTLHKILSKTKAEGTLLETSSRPLFSLSAKLLNFSFNKQVPHPPVYTLIMFSFPANYLISREILLSRISGIFSSGYPPNQLPISIYLHVFNCYFFLLRLTVLLR